MELEELKLEAKEYAKPWKDSLAYVSIKEAYLASAEPREKRIAELEEQNKWLEGCNSELAEHLGKANDRITGLEKENAELKADNDARKFAMAMSEKVEKQLQEENAELKKQLEMSNKVYNDNLDYSHHIEGQLTKAKEIIKYLCGMVRELNKPNVQLTDVDYSLSEAEQFLSEVEK